MDACCCLDGHLQIKPVLGGLHDFRTIIGQFFSLSKETSRIHQRTRKQTLGAKKLQHGVIEVEATPKVPCTMGVVASHPLSVRRASFGRRTNGHTLERRIVQDRSLCKYAKTAAHRPRAVGTSGSVWEL